jgi:hypothetical protein
MTLVRSLAVALAAISCISAQSAAMSPVFRVRAIARIASSAWPGETTIPLLI